METSSPFQRFLDLIEIDQQIEAQRKKIEAVEKEIAKLQSKNQNLVDDRARKEQQLIAAKKEVDAQEFEMKTLDEAEKKVKARLDLISNPKEYYSLKSEIDALKKKQHTLEEGLLQAWHVFEVRTKEFQDTQNQTQAQQEIIEQELALMAKNIAESLNTIESLTSKRVEIERDVPQEWLEKYILMRARVSDPVVPVLNGSCSACFYKIPEQDMVLLRRKKLVQCKDCYRLLYLQEPAKQ